MRKKKQKINPKSRTRGKIQVPTVLRCGVVWWRITEFSLEYSREFYKGMDLERAQERFCLHNHVTCRWPSSVFLWSPRLNRWQWQSKPMRFDIFQVKRCCMPQALVQINLCPSPDICSGSFQHYYYILFGITTLQLLGLIMHLSIKIMHSKESWQIPHFSHSYEF